MKRVGCGIAMLFINGSEETTEPVRHGRSEANHDEANITTIGRCIIYA